MKFMTVTRIIMTLKDLKIMTKYKNIKKPRRIN